MLRPHPKTTAPRRPRPEGQKDEAHLNLLRACPCLTCGAEPAEAAHLRYGDAEAGKPFTGKGQRPADRWANPLCPSCHRNGPDHQHSANERAWWAARGIDPINAAHRLYELSRAERDRGATFSEIAALMRALVRKLRREAHACR